MLRHPYASHDGAERCSATTPLLIQMSRDNTPLDKVHFRIIGPFPGFYPGDYQTTCRFSDNFPMGTDAGSYAQITVTRISPQNMLPAGDSEERAHMVYQRIGSPVPEAVFREARVYDGCVNGSDKEKAQCEQDKLAIAKEQQQCECCRGLWIHMVVCSWPTHHLNCS